MGNLTYHSLDSADYDDVLAMVSDWSVTRQLGRWKWPADPAQVRSFCKPYDGDGFLWTIKEDGVFAGRIGVTGGDLGYTLARSAHGRGIATAAARHAIAQAFDLLDLDVITGGTWEDNPASMRILQKLGFQHWQTRYVRSVARGYPVRVFHHRLTRAVWDRLNANAT